MARCKQHDIPEGFQRRWRVGGASWETDYANRIGCAIGYESDEYGRNLVRLRFDGLDSSHGPEEALFTPWQLFPVAVATGGRPGAAAITARAHPRKMQRHERSTSLLDHRARAGRSMSTGHH